MGLELREWDDTLAVQVFRTLDPHDQLEAELVRGQRMQGIGLFAEWRAVETARIASVIAVDARSLGCRPVAVLGLMNTGQAGVAQAALLARSHKANRGILARLGVMIRQGLPVFAAERGIHRVECRCWAGHPTAAGFLTACGFTLEAAMGGFGIDGGATFLQFAWTAPKTGD